MAYSVFVLTALAWITGNLSRDFRWQDDAKQTITVALTFATVLFAIGVYLGWSQC